MVVLNKQTVNFDQWVEKLMDEAKQRGIAQADLFTLYENYQSGMDIDEAIMNLENSNEDVVY